MRTAFDFAPLYRNSIGFDRIAKMIDAASQTSSNANNYPPYDIEMTGENQYTITLAVAGFTEQELEIQSENGVLQVRGKKEKDDRKRDFLYQGLAYRSFERKFQLADHVRVHGASLANGLLTVELYKEIPEAMKPRKIAINNNPSVEKLRA